MENIKNINGISYKEIKDFPSYYVGEDGTFIRFKNGEMKKLQISYDPNRNHTYLSVQTKQGKWRTIRPYILVAKVFIKNPNPKVFDSIGYRNGVEADLSVSNLYWKPRTNRKLTPEAVKYIKYSIENNTHTNVELSKMFGVSEMQISRIKSGENWGTKKFIRKELPFEVSDGKIRRFLSTFDIEERKYFKMRFKVRRYADNSNKNKIVGIINNHYFSLNHSNITRAKILADKLNKYFGL